MFCLCRNRPRPEEALIFAFGNLQLDEYQVIVLNERYIRVIQSFSTRVKRIDWMFNLTRFITTAGSLLVPALISIQYIKNVWWTDIDSFQVQVYWATWFLSVLVTLSNGLSQIYRFDKKYYFLHTTLELLKSEGWQYIALTGKYAGKDGAPSTHFNQFVVFYHNAERIKLRQVEEEYYKFTDLPNTTQPTNGKPTQTQGTTPSAQQQVPPQEKSLFDRWLGDMRSPQMRRGGLQPRIRQQESQRALDGAVASTPEIPRTPSGGRVSVLDTLPEEASPRATVVQTTSVSEIPQNIVVSVVPDQPAQRIRTPAKYGNLEPKKRTP
jgi:hypothetical protein